MSLGSLLYLMWRSACLGKAHVSLQTVTGQYQAFEDRSSVQHSRSPPVVARAPLAIRQDQLMSFDCLCESLKRATRTLGVRGRTHEASRVQLRRRKKAERLRGAVVHVRHPVEARGSCDGEEVDAGDGALDMRGSSLRASSSEWRCRRQLADLRETSLADWRGSRPLRAYIAQDEATE